MASYHKELKYGLITRMLPPNNESISSISKETGIPKSTLSEWKKKAMEDRNTEIDEIVKMPKTKRGLATLEKICLAAETLFYQKGYNNTSIVDITNLSGIGLGTFYIYFKDKYLLYKYLLLRYSHLIRKEIRDATAGVENRIEKERVGLRTFLKFTRENKHAYNIIWESLYIDKNLFIDYYDNFAARYASGIIEAQEKGEVEDYDPIVVSYFLMGVSNFIGLKYVMFDEENMDFDKVVDQVVDILVNGMFKKK
ncbi:TetR/AcrR family transcriptional regulator [Anaerocolumna sp.]|uniref:TetR/AcrR family transcriptional regulator n=1 Tax=Anaerocolumna sp. TaxID=2041569 RepID=UPI0028AC655F|nr:TetR/AcrR family transcriptional regulator [Anaerocolumna sp.]